MKKFILSALLLLMVTMTAFAENKAAAKVNGQILYQSEIRYILNQFLAKNGIDPKDISFDNPQLRNYKNDILERLIERELLYSVASQNVAKDIDERVEKVLANIQTQYPTQSEFKKALEVSGTSLEELTSKLRKNAVIDDYITSISEKVVVSDKEIKAFFNENKAAFAQEEKVKASHILIEIKGAVDADTAKQRIDKIYKELQYNTDFEAMAKKYSTGPSGKDGGALGFFRRKGDMVEPFAAKAFSMKVGEISEPVRSKFGYHIIKVYDRQEAVVPTLQNTSPKIKALLAEKKVKLQLDEQIKKIREKSKIEKFI